jgi:hypothetical protein
VTTGGVAGRRSVPVWIAGRRCPVMTVSRCGFVYVLLAVVVAIVLGRRVVEMPVRPHSTDPAIDERASPEAEVLMLRIRAKHRIVEDLVHGRRSLVEAAALFRELDRLPPQAKYFADLYPDPPLRLASLTEEEQYCIAVITYARNSLRVIRPDQAEAVTGRLVAEFWAERCERGEVRLPEATALAPVHELLERAP